MCVLEHSKQYGRPAYVQFNNGTFFNGPTKPNQLGRLTRMCLELSTTVVFTISHNTDPQAKMDRVKEDLARERQVYCTEE